MGSVGSTYPIQEEDMIESIRRVAQQRIDSGEWEQYKQEAIARVKNTVENPPPLEGITKAEVARSFYYDPTYVVPKNIVDHVGSVLYPAGYRVNPLDVVPFTQQFIFFDARDQQQVEYVKKFVLKKGKYKVKPIITGGSNVALMRKWKFMVYLDQGAALTRQLGITRVPSIVYQEGKRLRIDEVKL